MQQVTAELSYTPEAVIANPTFLAVVGDEIMGFYQLIEQDEATVELEALFVEPTQMGQGVGQSLFAHAVAQARSAGYRCMHIQSDPHAAGFYRKQGCVQVGEKASLSIPGRMLPLLNYDLIDRI